MTKYVLIQNDGEIETGAFELIGASTKRHQTGKIGFFGSGLKYSIAYMMRSGIDFKVFSGETELKFTSITETLRNQEFERICINGVPTSYTTTMGPTWKETWFVLREIYCNALDETNCQIIKNTDNINASAGKTRIYIELTPDLQKMISDWDAYFCGDRDVLFTQENVYTSYLGESDIQDDLFSNNKQKVDVFNKTGGVVFRRGVRVHSNPKYLYDYQFKNVNINEDRTMKTTGGLNYAISDMVAVMCNENYVVTILRSGLENKPSAEYDALSCTFYESQTSSKWVDFSQRYLIVAKEISGRYAVQIQTSTRECLFIPLYYAKKLKKQQPDIKILGLDKTVGDVSFSDVDRTPKMDFLLKDTIKSLTEMKYPVNYDISIVQFDEDTILGHADITGKHIFLAHKLFDLGRREIALTIMEESEHIKSGAHDETRAFQNHLISQWLKTMEDTNALFL